MGTSVSERGREGVEGKGVREREREREREKEGEKLSSPGWSRLVVLTLILFLY